MCFVECVSYRYTVPCKVMSDIVYTGVCEVVFGIVILCALWSVFHIVIQCLVKPHIVYSGVCEVVFDFVLLGFVK